MTGKITWISKHKLLVVLKTKAFNVSNSIADNLTLSPLHQGSKLTVVRFSRTTKNVLGQPNNVQWLPKGQPVVSKILYVFSPTVDVPDSMVIYMYLNCRFHLAVIWCYSLAVKRLKNSTTVLPSLNIFNTTRLF